METTDTRPATCKHRGDFLVSKIDDDDDFRIACLLDDGAPAKWLAPDGRDVSFTRAEIVDLHELLGAILAQRTR